MAGALHDIDALQIRTYLARSFFLTSFVVVFDAVAETIRLSSENRREKGREKTTCHGILLNS